MGSPGHLAIQGLRIALTVGLWLLAAIGVAQSWRAGRRDLRPYVLALVPFLMLPILNYGGEMLLRVTLFSLPFVAFFAAVHRRSSDLDGVAGREDSADPARHVLVLTLLLSVLCAASVTARYGNATTSPMTRWRRSTPPRRPRRERHRRGRDLDTLGGAGLQPLHQAHRASPCARPTSHLLPVCAP